MKNTWDWATLSNFDKGSTEKFRRFSFADTLQGIFQWISEVLFLKTPLSSSIPVGIYLLKVNKRNTRTKCEICSKLTLKTPKQCHWRPYGVFIVNFEYFSHLVQVFLLLILNMQLLTGIRQHKLLMYSYSIVFNWTSW